VTGAYLDRAPRRCQKHAVRHCTKPAVHPPGRLGRVVRLLICGLIGFVQMAATAHIGLVEHRLCAAHGKLVHSRHVAARSEHNLATYSTVGATVNDLDGEHEHCTNVTFDRDRFLLPPLAHAQGWLAGPAQPEGACVLEAPIFPIKAISLAPKHSPPA